MPVLNDRPETRSCVRAAPRTRRVRVSRFARTPDETLVHMTLQGRQSAFGELVQRYQRLVLTKAYSILHSREDAEDIAQDAFVKAYNTLGALRDPASFPAWLARIAVSTAIDRKRVRKANVSIEDLLEFECQSDTHVSAVEDAEDHNQLLAALRTLREDYREIIELKYLHGMAYQEIAEHLGMTTSAVGEKLTRVRKMLRKAIKRQKHPLD